MASTVPFPIRLAAGAVATGVDYLRRLPDELPGLSVTVAGNAMRASMRIQQEFIELAGRGDEVLAAWTGDPEEHPSWARFDEDEQEADADPAGTAGGPTDSGRQAGDGPAAQHDDDARTATAHAPSGVTGPEQLPGYDDLRLAQVRARLRNLDAPAVQALLDYEQSHRARASFLTLLDNRLTTLRSGDGA